MGEAENPGVNKTGEVAMPEEIREKRAKELLETFKAGVTTTTAESSPETKAALVEGSSPGEIKITKRKVQCKKCYQEYELPSGTTSWRCDICGTENTA